MLVRTPATQNHRWFLYVTLACLCMGWPYVLCVGITTGQGNVSLVSMQKLGKNRHGVSFAGIAILYHLQVMWTLSVIIATVAMSLSLLFARSRLIVDVAFACVKGAVA